MGFTGQLGAYESQLGNFLPGAIAVAVAAPPSVTSAYAPKRTADVTGAVERTEVRRPE
jgi:hypothetical protein